MVCCSGSCERCSKCGRYIYNLSSKYRKEVQTVEALATYGWGSISTDKCETHYMCGPNGNYAMYEPIEIEEQIETNKPVHAIATSFTHGSRVEEKSITVKPPKVPAAYLIDCDVDINEFFNFLQCHIPSGKVLRLYELLRKDFENALLGRLQDGAECGVEEADGTK